MKIEVKRNWIYRGFMFYSIMSNKDSYWFRHDASAGRGLKMRKMAHIYSHWGKGIYWDVIEILRDQKNYEFENDESSLLLLCDLVGCKDTARFVSWFSDCLRIGLFEENENMFFCPPLNANMVRWEASKNNGSKGGRPTKKPKPKPKNNLTDNLDETIIEEDSIEENKREEEEEFDIDIFYDVRELQKRYVSNDRLLSAFVKNNGVKKETLILRLEEYTSMLESTGRVKESFREYSSYFLNWSRTAPKKKSNTDPIKNITF